MRVAYAVTSPSILSFHHCCVRHCCLTGLNGSQFEVLLFGNEVSWLFSRMIRAKTAAHSQYTYICLRGKYMILVLQTHPHNMSI